MIGKRKSRLPPALPPASCTVHPCTRPLATEPVYKDFTRWLLQVLWLRPFGSWACVVRVRQRVRPELARYCLWTGSLSWMYQLDEGILSPYRPPGIDPYTDSPHVSTTTWKDLVLEISFIVHTCAYLGLLGTI